MKAMNSKLTIDAVRDALDFDPAIGIFVWRNPQSNAVKADEPAGVIAANGRRYINIGGEKHMAHRLAWFYIHGEWPSGDVKQPNGNYNDCRKVNLVLQTRQETATNRRLNSTSKSGYPGVSWDAKRNRWQAHITQNYKQVALGSFKELGDAIAARKEAERSLVLSVSDADKERAAHTISRRRRQRTAWKLVNASGPTGWASLDEFCKDIGDIPETKSAIVAIDPAMLIGPGNFRWSLPLDRKYDFQTREGRIAHGRDHRAANPEIYRERELRRSFGIGIAEYNAVLKAQGGVCAICERPERAVRDGELIHLAQDHDHATMKNRGILCGNCNKALGKFEDNTDFLRNAIVYLAKHSAPNPFVCDALDVDWCTAPMAGT